MSIEEVKSRLFLLPEIFCPAASLSQDFAAAPPLLPTESHLQIHMPSISPFSLLTSTILS